MFVLIVVKMVVAPQGFHPFERRIPGMDRIVHATIEEIAKHKAGKEHEYIVAHDQPVQEEEGRRDDEAGYGRHEQPFFVAGEMVVVAVHCIDELLGPLTFSDGMEGIAMHQIFKEGPKEHAAEENEGDAPGQEAEIGSRMIEEVNDDR